MISKCPICSSDSVTIFHHKVWSFGEGKVFRCGCCGVAFVWPMFTDEEEREFYAKYNAHLKARGDIVSDNPEERHIKSRVIAKERWGLVKHYIQMSNSVLEIGSATGAFLELCNVRMLAGVDPDEISRKYSEQFAEIVYADILQIKGVSFDTICMFHMLEHSRNPYELLGNCRELLVEGGYIVIEVPHIEDPLISIYNLEVYKDFYFMPMHPFVYSLQALRHVFSKSGFREERVMYCQRYGLANHLAWLTKRVPGGDPYLNSLFIDDQSYRKALIGAEKTDTLYYIATKSS